MLSPTWYTSALEIKGMVALKSAMIAANNGVCTVLTMVTNVYLPGFCAQAKIASKRVDLKVGTDGIGNFQGAFKFRMSNDQVAVG